MVGRLWVGGIVAGLLVLHLLASYAEAKGWICYRQGSGRGTSAALSNALAEFEAIIDPAAEHRLEEERSQRVIRSEAISGQPADDEGGPPTSKGAALEEP